MHVLSILGSCAEIACCHLGDEPRMHLTAIGSDCARPKAKEQLMCGLTIGTTARHLDSLD
jgi:hypothetical protein